MRYVVFVLDGVRGEYVVYRAVDSWEEAVSVLREALERHRHAVVERGDAE